MFETKQTPKGKTTYSVEFKWRAVQMYIEEVNGIYGYYRVKAWIKRNYGKTVNHKRVYRLMKELGV